jgi:ribosome-associated protein
VDQVAIRGDVIRLGQLLKLAGVAGSGAEAKELLAAGAVRVNGEVDGRRGRQVHPGDVIDYTHPGSGAGDRCTTFVVVTSSSSSGP